MLVMVDNQLVAVMYIGEIYAAFVYQMTLLKLAALAAWEGQGYIPGATAAESAESSLVRSRKVTCFDEGVLDEEAGGEHSRRRCSWHPNHLWFQPRLSCHAPFWAREWSALLPLIRPFQQIDDCISTIARF